MQCRAAWGSDMPVFLCFWHVKRSWLKNIIIKCKKGTAVGLFKRLGQIMLMLPKHREVPDLFKERVQTTLEDLLQEHADQADFVKYFRSTWVHKLGTF